MLAYSKIEVLEALCIATKKWGLFISIFDDDNPVLFQEIVKAASFLDYDNHGQIIVDKEGWFLFNSEKDMEEAYSKCVGRDGPTKLNSYEGDVVVYALTCDPEGYLITENL